MAQACPSASFLFPSILPHTTRSAIKTAPKLVNFCVSLFCLNCLYCLYYFYYLYCLYCLNYLYCLYYSYCLYYLYCLYCFNCLNCLNCLYYLHCIYCLYCLNCLYCSYSLYCLICFNSLISVVLFGFNFKHISTLAKVDFKKWHCFLKSVSTDQHLSLQGQLLK